MTPQKQRLFPNLQVWKLEEKIIFRSHFWVIWGLTASHDIKICTKDECVHHFFPEVAQKENDQCSYVVQFSWVSRRIRNNMIITLLPTKGVLLILWLTCLNVWLVCCWLQRQHAHRISIISLPFHSPLWVTVCWSSNQIMVWVVFWDMESFWYSLCKCLGFSNHLDIFN